MKAIFQIMRRELRRMVSRRAYLWAMVLVPLGMTVFFVSLMAEGLPQPVPTAVVDLDNSTLSRQVIRNLETQQTIGRTSRCESFNEAIDKVRSGEIFGFFYIPRDFASDAFSGKQPVISYYTNMTYFVPATLAYKGFKTMAVGTSGAIVETKMELMGVPDALSGTLLQPVQFDIHALGNPWMNYSIYLSNSFAPCTLALMVLLMTVFSICIEIKDGTSPRWMEMAGGNVYVALAGKLLPQTLLFLIVGLGMDGILFGYEGFPMNGSWAGMIGGMLLMIVATQALGVIFTTLVPNMRLALSACALTGILAFSIAGFSFPVEQMYGSIAIISYILPIRYYFLIYIDQALNGIDLWYSRTYFGALMLFPVVASAIAWRLKRFLLKPVYLP